MNHRKTFRAGGFYPDNDKEIKAFINENLRDITIDNNIKDVKGGIVPHAGWVYSGATALKVYKTIRDAQDSVDTFLIFGAVHVPGVRKASIYSSGSWETPLGDVLVDEELAEMVLSLGNIEIEENTSAHVREHSIEVQIPMIKYLFEDIKILPIMTPPIEAMTNLGSKIGKLLDKSQKNVCVIGSSDLSHYGPRFGFTEGGTGKKGYEYMKKNDKSIIDIMIDMDYEKVIRETMSKRNACGGGAIVATMSALSEMGKDRGNLLEYTTSYDVRPFGDPSDAVGYAGIVY